MTRPTPPEPRKTCCTETECGPGRKNRYFVGKRLTPDSYRVEQAYGTDRRRLLNRAIHGWGVVHGFGVTPQHDEKRGSRRLLIGPGLALDRCGRELLRTQKTPLEMDALILIGKGGKRVGAEEFGGNIEADRCWLLSAHYAERHDGPADGGDGCGCGGDREEWNFTCETVRFSLRAVDCEECQPDTKCRLKCECKHGDKSYSDDAVVVRGADCLCRDLADIDPDDDCGCLTEVDDDCGPVSVDLANGVPIACVKVARGDNGCLVIQDPDVCGPRRIVKGNDVLFDLIRGCDLTVISDFGWKAWHRKGVSFEDFSKAFGNVISGEEKCVTNFWVKFSRPINGASLRADCFAMTALVTEPEGGWWQPLRIPVLDVVLEGQDTARMVVEVAWVLDAVRGPHRRFRAVDVSIEIEVRGDFIIDCNGQAVDANPVGTRAVPTGNGTPGGTFVSTFQVKRPQEKPITKE